MSVGRIVRAGGVQVEPAGFSTRTDGNPPALRPGYRVSEGNLQPSGTGGIGGGGGPIALFDLSTVSGWRMVAVLAAVAYIWGFHASLGRVRVGVGG